MIMYASYGVLAHEKEPVLSLSAPATDAYDVYDFDLPDGWSLHETSVPGHYVFFDPDGDYFLPAEVLPKFFVCARRCNCDC